MKKMKRIILALVGGVFLFCSCTEYNKVLKTTDYEYKYDAAKAYFVKGQYSKVSYLLTELLAMMKGTIYGEESLYMLALSEYYSGNYDTASAYFKKYYQSYPKGQYAELACFYAGKALYQDVPDSRLDQSATYSAIEEFQNFLDLFPYTQYKDEANNLLMDLQDKLVEKEYIAAKLYYDLGDYTGNCIGGGSNYEACIVTAQNALNDYPFARPERREDFSILLLRARFHLALQSVAEKQEERFRAAIDEYYAFVNEFPESKYLAEAEKILRTSEKRVK